ncbi:HGxxPAAW family protein [Streptomyces sp. NPDC014623]|uniref:HGxxPAAW family protein n=1 Tax=Streptomyces sp. NPDC014623 TaxID=3364875 RepID=UPI0036FA4092
MSAHGDHDLGHTVAGWTGTALGVLGSAVLGAAVITTSAALLGLGAVVVALAAATCWALHLAGWGKPTGPRPKSRQGWRSRDTSARRGHPGCLGCRMAGRGRLRPAAAAGLPSAPAPPAPAPSVPALPVSDGHLPGGPVRTGAV